MQTIKINQQRKPIAFLLALTMIASLMLQLIAPISVQAEELSETRTINIETQYEKAMINSDNPPEVITTTHEIIGQGTFVVRGWYKHYTEDANYSFLYSYVFSNMGFTLNGNNAIKYNGVYYYPLISAYGGTNFTPINVPNCAQVSEIIDVKKFIDSGVLDLTKDNYVEFKFNAETATYDASIPTPKLTVNNDYSFGFNNASNDFYFQVKGRWYTVEDIELYKELLQWKYKYNSIIKSNLTEWVTTQDKKSVNDNELNFATFGKTAFNSFLEKHPAESRSYSGGTNAIGNYFSGYNDALSTIYMLLEQPTSIYNGIEVYVRYYKFDDNGNALYGKWCHYYDNLASASGSTGSRWDDNENMFTGNQSASGLDNDQLENVENLSDSRNDVDLQPEYNSNGFNSVILGDIDTSSLSSSLESMYKQAESFINMFGTVFNFMPPWIIALICASLGVICIIGIWKCIRG